MHRLHGEGASVDTEAADEKLPEIQEIVSRYNPKNIYNMDETALYYSAAPKTTISTNKVSGTKVDKKRLTIALTVNSDGSDKRRPMIIGHAERPASFKRKYASDYGFMDYHFNLNAWMTKKIFKDYLRKFDRAMKAADRKILLILDNFSGHYLDAEGQGPLSYKPTNIELLYLPPNVTALLQPLDAGIIKSFKSHYRYSSAD